MNAVTLDRAGNGNLTAKRLSLDESLNFRLPDALTAAGACRFSVSSIRIADTGDEVVRIGAASPLDLEFVETPPLRVRLVSFRYRRGNPAR
jgi:hypothetical protein